MDALDLVAIIGAGAWVPQITKWVGRKLTMPKISLYVYPQLEIGYNTYGPIFNTTLALLSEKKDTILNKISVKFKHEHGASYIFDWDGLSEDISEIQTHLGPTIYQRKTSLPLVVKVLHTGVAQVFVRFRHKQFKEHCEKPYASAMDRYNLLKTSGKLKTKESIDALVTETEFDKLIKLFDSEFIWTAGKYTMTFDFGSPHKLQHLKKEYIFKLNQDDVNKLRKNVDNIKPLVIDLASRENIPDYKAKEINWQWVNPILEKEESTPIK